MPGGLLTVAIGYGPILDSCAVGPPSVSPQALAVELAIEPRRVMMSLNFESPISFHPLDIAIRDWHHRNERVDLRLVRLSGGHLPCSRLRFLALSLPQAITCFLDRKLDLRAKGTQQLGLEKGLSQRQCFEKRMA